MIATVKWEQGFPWTPPLNIALWQWKLSHVSKVKGWPKASPSTEFFCKVKVRYLLLLLLLPVCSVPVTRVWVILRRNTACNNPINILLHTHTPVAVIDVFFKELVHKHSFISLSMSCLAPLFCSADQKPDKTSLYNFSKLKKNRKWLKVYNMSLFCPRTIYHTRPAPFISPLSPAEHLVEWQHHRLWHRLRWLWLQFVTGGAAWHAETAPLHQTASEQVPHWPGGTSVKNSTWLLWKIPCTFVFATTIVCCFHPCVSFLQLQQYQFYSTGLLSSQDPFYEQQRHLLGPKKKKIKDEKKIKGKEKKNLLKSSSC